MGDLYLRERIILLHADPLLGVDREIGDCIVGVAKQRPADDNRKMVRFEVSRR
jgi:hypothetical protein